MMDSENPYASPLSLGAAPTSPVRDRSVPKHPWFSRLLLIGLLLNVVLAAAMIALTMYAGWVGTRQPGQDPPMSLILALGFTMMGVAAYWPISSLAMLVYSITVDRGTPWWLLKSIVSGTMLLLWLSCCLAGVVFG